MIWIAITSIYDVNTIHMVRITRQGKLNTRTRTRLSFLFFSRDTCHNPILLLPLTIFYRFICEGTIRIGSLIIHIDYDICIHTFNIILRDTIYDINNGISVIINRLTFKTWIRHRKANMPCTIVKDEHRTLISLVL